MKCLILLLYLIETNSKIISFPFKYSSTKNNNNYNFYNSSHFLNDYFIKELLIQMDIGTPSQKINAYLNSKSYCFKFKQSESNYYPFKSSSFSIDKDDSSSIYSLNYITLSDKFNFDINQDESYKLSFQTAEKLNKSKNNDISLIPEIGINNPLMYISYAFTCNNFLNDLRNMKIINHRIYSIVCTNNYEGNFILGDELYKYDSIDFKKEQYYKKYFVYEFILMYDEIYAKYSSNKIEHLNITGNTLKRQGIININSGLIIGTNEFNDFIYKIFFKNLIDINICFKDLVELKQEKVDDRLGNYFYIYNCKHAEILEYLTKFPNIIFNSKSFEYDFELTYKDLFKQINDKRLFYDNIS